MSATGSRLAAAVRHFPWQRLIVCMTGCALVLFFLQTHRNWVWAYFDSMMQISKPSPELASVASQSISAITTIAITGITGIVGIVMFFITGNVAALSTMFKFSSTAQAIGSVTAAAENINEERTETIDQTMREFCTQDLKDRYGDR